jgi:putative transcriptional regulator
LVCKLGSFGDEKIMKNKLKVYRAIHDLTQEELANKLGVTRATINAIERGEIRPFPTTGLQNSTFF